MPAVISVFLNYWHAFFWPRHFLIISDFLAWVSVACYILIRPDVPVYDILDPIVRVFNVLLDSIVHVFNVLDPTAHVSDVLDPPESSMLDDDVDTNMRFVLTPPPPPPPPPAPPPPPRRPSAGDLAGVVLVGIILYLYSQCL